MAGASYSRSPFICSRLQWSWSAFEAAMKSTHVNLDTIELAPRSAPVKLLLTSSLSILLPDNLEEESSANWLSLQVASGQLWIERASPCRLSVTVVVKDDSVHSTAAGRVTGNDIVEVIRQCTAWEQLGICLSRSQNHQTHSAESPYSALFSINHVSASSSHMACPYPTRAQLQTLSCSFEFIASSEHISNAKSTKTTTDTPRTINPEFTRVTRSATQASEEQPQDEMTLGDQPLKTADDTDHGLDLLVKGALYTLLGVKKKVPGVKVLQPPRSPCLLELAPGVWNVWYLQSVVGRSPFLPHIATVFSRLASDARSPTLRRSAKRLGDTSLNKDRSRSAQDLVAPAAEGIGPEPYGLSDRIGKRIWPILQRGISFTATPRRGSMTYLAARHDTGMEQEDGGSFLYPDQDWGLDGEEMILAYGERDTQEAFAEDQYPEYSEDLEDCYEEQTDVEFDEDTDDYEIEEMIPVEYLYEGDPLLYVDEEIDDDELVVFDDGEQFLVAQDEEFQDRGDGDDLSAHYIGESQEIGDLEPWGQDVQMEEVIYKNYTGDTWDIIPQDDHSSWL